MAGQPLEQMAILYDLRLLTVKDGRRIWQAIFWFDSHQTAFVEGYASELIELFVNSQLGHLGSMKPEVLYQPD